MENKFVYLVIGNVNPIVKKVKVLKTNDKHVWIDTSYNNTPFSYRAKRRAKDISYCDSIGECKEYLISSCQNGIIEIENSIKDMEAKVELLKLEIMKYKTEELNIMN